MAEEASWQRLARADLWSLEDYAVQRPDFRARVIAHKKNRHLALGANARLYFEDRLTVQYQIQEMLRIEKLFEPDAIAEELATYNPLIPDGDNWKATFMLEFENPAERARRLAQMVGVEHRVWLQVADCARVYAIADEDLERSTADKTSAVHFLRYPLDAPTIAAVHSGAGISAGIDHPACPIAGVCASAAVRAALAADLAQ